MIIELPVASEESYIPDNDENTFAANVGDFSDASEAKISETKTGSKYKAAHANSEASGKK